MDTDVSRSSRLKSATLVPPSSLKPLLLRIALMCSSASSRERGFSSIKNEKRSAKYDPITVWSCKQETVCATKCYFSFERGATLGSLGSRTFWPTNKLDRQQQQSFNIPFLSKQNAYKELDKERVHSSDYKPNRRRLLLVEEATLPRSFIRPFSLQPLALLTLLVKL